MNGQSDRLWRDPERLRSENAAMIAHCRAVVAADTERAARAKEVRKSALARLQEYRDDFTPEEFAAITSALSY